MTFTIIIIALLAIVIIYMLMKMNQRARAIESLEKQSNREWMLKVALEQSCKIPGVEADELAPIEPEINRLMESAKSDPGAEEKIRTLIMGLYEAKVGGKKAEKEAHPAQKPAQHHDNSPITGRNPAQR